MSKVKTVKFLVYEDVRSLETCEELLWMLRVNNRGVRFDIIDDLYKVGDRPHIKYHIAVYLNVVEEDE